MVTVLGQPLEVVETEIPKIEPHQILVKTRACGVCHTDLHAAAGDWPVKPRLPLIPGHEGVGEVVEVGGAVKGLKIGDRVGVPSQRARDCRPHGPQHC